MKYLFWFILWIILTAYLIIEVISKGVATTIIFIWDFKIIKNRYWFWDEIDIIVPLLIIPMHYSAKNLKDYYLFHWTDISSYKPKK